MDLSTPLRTISPGLDAGVLTVLARTEASLSATSIARLAGYGTRNGQAPVLARLVSHGLVLTEPGNLGPLYRLNREHVLAGAVLAAVDARADLLSRLRTALVDLGPGLVHASVFGSFARGEAAPDSDIDLLLVSVDDRPGDWNDRLVDLRARVRAWTGNDGETVSLTQSHLAEVAPGEAVVTAWITDAVTLHGPDLPALLARLERRS